MTQHCQPSCSPSPYPTPVTPELMLSHRSASGRRPFNNSQTVSALENEAAPTGAIGALSR